MLATLATAALAGHVWYGATDHLFTPDASITRFTADARRDIVHVLPDALNFTLVELTNHDAFPPEDCWSVRP